MIYLGNQAVGNTVVSGGRSFDPMDMQGITLTIVSDAVISSYDVEVSTEPIDISGSRSETVCETNILSMRQNSDPKLDTSVFIPRRTYVLIELFANKIADVRCDMTDFESGEMEELECTKRFTMFQPTRYAWEVSFYVPENSGSIEVTFMEEGE